MLVLGVLLAVLAALLHKGYERGDFRPRLVLREIEGSFTEGRPRVLFVGNSFTSANDLPRMFASIALSLGTRVAVDSHVPGGQTLEGHSKDPAALAKIKARDWDFVVLQEQSQKPAFSPEQVEAETTAPALRLNSRIHDAHPAAKVVFYETWGRRNGDDDNCGHLPDICTYEGMQKRLNESYTLMVQRSSGTLAPVGEAWAKVRAEHPKIELYSGDGVHPSPQGTYLAACVFYAVLMHKRLAGAESFGLDRQEALLLQKAAEEIVFNPPRPKGAPAIAP